MVDAVPGPPSPPSTSPGEPPVTARAFSAVTPLLAIVWLAGAGLKHGIAYGTSDDIGWKAAESPVDVHDFHATILQLLGIDHERLTFYHNGIQRRLTNVHGNVLTGLLA